MATVEPKHIFEGTPPALDRHKIQAPSTRETDVLPAVSGVRSAAAAGAKSNSASLTEIGERTEMKTNPAPASVQSSREVVLRLIDWFKED